MTDHSAPVTPTGDRASDVAPWTAAALATVTIAVVGLYFGWVAMGGPAIPAHTESEVDRARNALFYFDILPVLGMVLLLAAVAIRIRRPGKRGFSQMGRRIAAQQAAFAATVLTACTLWGFRHDLPGGLSGLTYLTRSGGAIGSVMALLYAAAWLFPIWAVPLIRYPGRRPNTV